MPKRIINNDSIIAIPVLYDHWQVPVHVPLITVALSVAILPSQRPSVCLQRNTDECDRCLYFIVSTAPTC